MIEASLEVCDNCFRRSCFMGLFYCEGARDAGTVFLEREDLLNMAYEHPAYVTFEEFEDDYSRKVDDDTNAIRD